MTNMDMKNVTMKELSAEELMNVSAGADSNPAGANSNSAPNGNPLLALIWLLHK